MSGSLSQYHIINLHPNTPLIYKTFSTFSNSYPNNPYLLHLISHSLKLVLIFLIPHLLHCTFLFLSINRSRKWLFQQQESPWHHPHLLQRNLHLLLHQYSKSLRCVIWSNNNTLQSCLLLFAVLKMVLLRILKTKWWTRLLRLRSCKHKAGMRNKIRST